MLHTAEYFSRSLYCLLLGFQRAGIATKASAWGVASEPSSKRPLPGHRRAGRRAGMATSTNAWGMPSERISHPVIPMITVLAVVSPRCSNTDDAHPCYHISFDPRSSEPGSVTAPFPLQVMPSHAQQSVSFRHDTARPLSCESLARNWRREPFSCSMQELVGEAKEISTTRAKPREGKGAYQ